VAAAHLVGEHQSFEDVLQMVPNDAVVVQVARKLLEPWRVRAELMCEPSYFG
jgi:hypothetical protein